MACYVYMMASRKDGPIYIGVSSDLIKRTYQHKEKFIDSFTKRYNISRLVYYEVYDDIENTIIREKRLKKYKRVQKIKLIEKDNPYWNDLYEEIIK